MSMANSNKIASFVRTTPSESDDNGGDDEMSWELGAIREGGSTSVISDKVQQR